MKIYLLTSNANLESGYKKKLEKLGWVSYLELKGVSEKKVVNRIQEADVLLVSPTAIIQITDFFFRSLPNLKHVALLSSGYEWVDIRSAIKHHVSISHCIGTNAESVAEYTWAMILSLVRKLNCFNSNIWEKNISKFNFEGIELFEKTIGILGTGNIGTRVARIAKAFNMYVSGYNKSFKLAQYFDEIVNLETLLLKSDVISINLPLTNETEGLIGRKEISLAKKSVIIVNTAREEIVDKQAILEGIKQGKIYGYGLDTNLTNPLPPTDPYLKYKNILVTLHSGYNTKEAKERMMNTAIKNIEAFISGRFTNLIGV